MPDADREQVLAVLRAQEAAVARGDAAGVLDAQAPGIVTYDIPPPLESRGDAERDAGALERWFGTWDGPVRTTLADPTILVDGDLAVAFGLSRMQGVKKDSGPLDAWNRRTVVLRREGGSWRIVHDHGSYPMAMDGSGRALTELTP